MERENGIPVSALLLQDEKKLAELLRGLDVSLFEYFPKEDLFVAYDKDMNVHWKCPGYLARLEEHTRICRDDQPKVRALLRDKSGASAELRLTNDEGETEYYNIFSILRGESETADGEPVIGFMRDISRQREDESALRERASRDSMTLLYNRSSGQKLIDEYLQSKDPFVSCGIIVMDIDFFKSINDNYGHLFGDTVLISLARLISEEFGEDSIALRAGGDEFVVFIKNISRKTLIHRTATMLDKVRALKFEENDRKITCSVGVCFLPENTFGYTYRELFANADWALYRAKKFGRDRYEFCDSLHRYEAAPPAARPKDDDIDERYLRNDVISTAFEIFEKLPSFDAAIKLLLKVVGLRMQLDRITVISTDTREQTTARRYMWTGPNVPEVLDEPAEFTKEDFLTLFRSYDANGTTVLHYDNMSMYSEGAQRLLMQGGAKTVVYGAMYCEGHYSGAISYVTCDSKRHWSQMQRSQIGELTKIISAHLAKSRVMNFSQSADFARGDMDPLTGLISFSRFREEIERIIVGNTNEKYLLTYSDIEDFKYLNQKYGYSQGDQLLKDFASHVIGKFTSETNVYFTRVVADQFVCFMPYPYYGENNDAIIAEKIDEINKQFVAKWAKNFPTFAPRIRSGVYAIGPECGGASAAIDAANYARHQVRANSNVSVCVYSSELAAVHDAESDIISGMDRAFKNNELKVYLQPKYSLADNSIIGAEALVRWQTPDGRMLVADDFVSVYERAGRIIELDFYVFETVVQFLAKNQRLGRRQVPISINASRMHLQDVGTVQRYMDILKKHDVPYTLAEIELSENSITSEYADAMRLLRQFQNVHILAALDDFGAGRSVLDAAIDMPVSTVKIDRTLLNACEMSDKGVYMFKQITATIKGLGYSVLCEGVETERELELLRAAGCDAGQGYYFSKPLTIEEYEKLVYKE